MERETVLPTGAVTDVMVSDAAHRYIETAFKLLDFTSMVVAHAGTLDELYNKIFEIADSRKGRQPRAEVRSAREAFDQHADLLLEMLMCKGVDNFLLYLSDFLASVFRRRPEMLKSDEKVSVEFLLEYSDYTDLLDALTERKVLDLSFRGMVALQDVLRRSMKFEIFPSDVELAQAVRINEVRNLFIHNRGIISRRFLSRVPSYAGKVGDSITPDISLILADLQFLMRSVLSVDKRGCEKFSIAIPHGLPRRAESFLSAP